jgi:hypothetical protein
VFAKKIRKSRNRWKLMESDRGGDSIEENISNEDAELTVLAYSLYMKEVITALMKHENPKVNMDDKETDIKLAVKATLEFSKEIYHVS